MKYCPLKMLINNDENNCKICMNKNNYYLKNEDDEFFKIITTKHYAHIMHKEPIDRINNINLCIEKGIYNFRIDLLDETKEEIEYMLNKIKKEINNGY
jgi:collagenase-like PrtC family protease